MSDIVNIAISCCEDLLSQKWAPEDACERIEKAINEGIRVALAARTEECARVVERAASGMMVKSIAAAIRALPAPMTDKQEGG
jgi:hypothetical protein